MCYFLSQDAILTTMDIISDGFGFMLVFGDLVWVPFLYCLQTRFLAEQDGSLPWYCLVGIAVLNSKYVLFRKMVMSESDNGNEPSLSLKVRGEGGH
jgi:hypothetical protein